MEIANIHEAKARLSRLIELALAGEDVQIARAGEPLVRLVPVDINTQPRQGGQLKGQVWIGMDFDEPDPAIDAIFGGVTP